MSTKKFLIAALVAAGLVSGTAVWAEVTASAPAPAAASPATAASEINYVSQLPTPSELSKAQAPAGTHLAKIRQTSAEIAVTYVYANGQSQVVSYRLLGNESDAIANAPVASPLPAVAPSAASEPPVTVIQSPSSAPPPPVYYYDAPPTVVYQSAPPVYYYDRPSYYPWFPLSLGLNFGFRGGSGFHGGGFRGGFHGGGFHGGGFRH